MINGRESFGEQASGAKLPSERFGFGKLLIKVWSLGLGFRFNFFTQNVPGLLYQDLFLWLSKAPASCAKTDIGPSQRDTVKCLGPVQSPHQARNRISCPLACTQKDFNEIFTAQTCVGSLARSAYLSLPDTHTIQESFKSGMYSISGICNCEGREARVPKPTST
jgi:hypothetical protein